MRAALRPFGGLEICICLGEWGEYMVTQSRVSGCFCLGAAKFVSFEQGGFLTLSNLTCSHVIGKEPLTPFFWLKEAEKVFSLKKNKKNVY